MLEIGYGGEKTGGLRKQYVKEVFILRYHEMMWNFMLLILYVGWYKKKNSMPILTLIGNNNVKSYSQDVNGYSN